MNLSTDNVIALTGIVLPAIAALITAGKLMQVIKDLTAAARELRDATVELASRTTALETTTEAHSERLDRLELPLFDRR